MCDCRAMPHSPRSALCHRRDKDIQALYWPKPQVWCDLQLYTNPFRNLCTHLPYKARYSCSRNVIELVASTNVVDWTSDVVPLSVVLSGQKGINPCIGKFEYEAKLMQRKQLQELNQYCLSIWKKNIHLLPKSTAENCKYELDYDKPGNGIVYLPVAVRVETTKSLVADFRVLDCTYVCHRLISFVKAWPFSVVTNE